MSIDELSRRTAEVADSTVERRGAEKHQRAAAAPGPPIFDWRELQRWGIPESRLPPGSVVRYRASEPVERIQGHGAERRRRAGGPIAPDRRAPVPAPRAPAGRDRQPEEPGARRRRQPPRDDVGADQLDWTRARPAARLDDAQRPGAADDGHRESCDARHDRRDPVRHPGPGRPRHADHRSPSDDAPKPSAGEETDRSARRHRRDPGARRPRHATRGRSRPPSICLRVRASSTAIRCSCSRCS